MPMTKLSEIRTLKDNQIIERVKEAKRELMEFRFQGAIGQLSENHRVGDLRREVARLLTVLGERRRNNG